VFGQTLLYLQISHDVLVPYAWSMKPKSIA
jgi:hypothetical protein